MGSALYSERVTQCQPAVVFRPARYESIRDQMPADPVATNRDRIQVTVYSIDRRILIGIPSVALPLAYGGSHEVFWAPVAGVFLLLAALAVAVDPALFGRFRLTYAILPLLLVLALPFCQILPVPIGWLEFLSPIRARWLAQAAVVTGQDASVAPLSYVPLATFGHGLLWLFLALFALALWSALGERRFRNAYFHLLLAIGTLEALYGLVQVLVPTLGVLWDPGRAYAGFARGTFINRNHYGAFLGLLWPLLLGHVLALREVPTRSGGRYGSLQAAEQAARQRRVLYGFLIGLMVLALIFSGSRGAILSSIVAATLFALLSGLRRRTAFYAVGACWLVMLAYGSILGFAEIAARFNQIDAGAAGRFEIWRETWVLARDHALTGSGLGSYSEVYKVYQGHLPEAMVTRHAHNDYLQLAAELGLPAAIAIAAAVWLWWWREALHTFRGRHSGDPARTLARAGALAGAAAMLLHSWLDFNLQMAANLQLLVATLVWARALRADRTG